MKFSIPPRWGIRILAGWSLVLALLAASYLLILSKSVELYSNQFGNQFQVWLIFIFNVAFTVGFAAAAYGLWQYQNWGRLTFLGLIVAWTSINLVGTVFPALSLSSVQQPPLLFVVNLLRYVVALLVPLLYLNLPQIKVCFCDQTPQTL